MWSIQGAAAPAVQGSDDDESDSEYSDEEYFEPLATSDEKQKRHKRFPWLPIEGFLKIPRDKVEQAVVKLAAMFFTSGYTLGQKYILKSQTSLHEEVYSQDYKCKYCNESKCPFRIKARISITENDTTYSFFHSPEIYHNNHESRPD